VADAVCGKNIFPSDEDLASAIALLVRGLRAKGPGAFNAAVSTLVRLLCSHSDVRQLTLDAGALSLLVAPLHVGNMAAYSAKLVYHLLESSRGQQKLELLEETEGLLPALVAALRREDAAFGASVVLAKYVERSDEESVLQVAQMDGAVTGLVHALSSDRNASYAARAFKRVAETCRSEAGHLMADAAGALLPAIAAAFAKHPGIARTLAAILTNMAQVGPSLAAAIAGTRGILAALVATGNWGCAAADDLSDAAAAAREALRTIAQHGAVAQVAAVIAPRLAAVDDGEARERVGKFLGDLGFDSVALETLALMATENAALRAEKQAA